jgi:DNA-binding MarR family transcriptional regulator
MNDNEKTVDSYRSFLLMSEITGEEPISQREISRRLGIAVGLVNSYLKNLVAKGYVRVKDFPSNRYAYLLTPQGLAEKSRLAYQHLSYFNNLYRIARQEYLALFHDLHSAGVTSVAFCGVDEVAEVAYLSLQETGLELTAVMDDTSVRTFFFTTSIATLDESVKSCADRIVITSFKRGAELREKLLQLDVKPERIISVGMNAAN